MRVLLDEMIPIRLRLEFGQGFSIETAEYNNWKGLDNGEILPLAEQAGFDCVVTRDRSIPHQRNLRTIGVGVVVVRPRGQDFDDWVRVVPAIERALEKVRPGSILRVGPQERE